MMIRIKSLEVEGVLVMRMVVFQVLCVCCLLLLGCGRSDGVTGVNVSGTITMDGKPLDGVEVYFINENFEGYGKTNSEGKYQLVNGAAVGNNKVYLKRFNIAGGGGVDLSVPGMDAGQAAAMAEAQEQSQKKTGDKKKSSSMIPPEYSNPNTTKLKFSVPDGGTSAADFRISSM